MASQFPGSQPPPYSPPPPHLPPAGGGLVGRVQRVLTQPKDERYRVDAEPMTLQQLYVGWILPLAAIAPIMTMIRTIAFPFTFMGITVRVSPVSAIGTAIVSYILAVAMVFVTSLIIDALAPTFNGQKNQVQATKVVAFASTAGWVAGVFQIIPSLTLISLLGLLAAIYGIYLLYLALPVMMKVPQDKAVGYIVVVIVVAIVAFFIVGALAGIASALFVPSTAGLGSVTIR